MLVHLERAFAPSRRTEGTTMRHRLLLSSALVLFALGSVGCSLSIEKTFAMQPGSGLDLFFVSYDDPPIELPNGRLTLDGGTVMTIDVSTSLLDYLDGTMDGQVTVNDLLFDATGLSFFGSLDLGPLCIALTGPSGGSFQYKVVQQTAAFDVMVDTSAIMLDKTYVWFTGTDTFPFPFHLQAEMPLGLADAVGLFLGTSEMDVSQHIDEIFNFGSGPTPIKMHVRGDVNLRTQDAFPTTPLLEQCLAEVST
jgi:hypothetical protein